MSQYAKSFISVNGESVKLHLEPIELSSLLWRGGLRLPPSLLKEVVDVTNMLNCNSKSSVGLRESVGQAVDLVL
jgi:hypothetical protein